MLKINFKKLIFLILITACVAGVLGCVKKTPKPVVNNNIQPVNQNVNVDTNTNTNTNQNGDVLSKILSDKIISNIKVVNMKDAGLIFDPWDKDSESFLFRVYDTENCEIFCSYDLYKYYIEKNNTEIIQPKEESLLKKDWIISNNKKFAVKVVSGYSNNPNEDLGTIYIKNLQTNKIKTLGKKTYKGGDQDKYIFSYYNNPVWSPDDKWVAFYDYNSGEVTVMSFDASDISEIKILGKTFFIATARNDEYYIYWSPDSTKLFAKDGYSVFSVDPIIELYHSNMDKEWVAGGNPWRWSPDSKKILGLGIVGVPKNLYFYIMDYDGKNKKIIIPIKNVSDNILELSADWSPDSKDIVYAYNQSMYILDIETMNKTEIMEKGKNYFNPHWSPDGKKIIYELDDQIWMITLN